MKSKSLVLDFTDLDSVGRSYYCFCIETALEAIVHARALVAGDSVDASHELPAIEAALIQALKVS